MIFNQLFDNKSSTYTYIISSGKGREALIIDPVIEHTDEYVRVLESLDLKLVKVIDTHIHADHTSGIGELRNQTNCATLMGEKAPDTADAMKRYKSGKAGFTDKSHLKAKGLIPRADGTKQKSDKYK